MKPHMQGFDPETSVDVMHTVTVQPPMLQKFSEVFVHAWQVFTTRLLKKFAGVQIPPPATWTVTSVYEGFVAAWPCWSSTAHQNETMAPAAGMVNVWHSEAGHGPPPAQIVPAVFPDQTNPA